VVGALAGAVGCSSEDGASGPSSSTAGPTSSGAGGAGGSPSGSGASGTGASSSVGSGAAGGGGSGGGPSPADVLQGIRYEVPCGTYYENDEVCENFPSGQTSCPAEGNYDFKKTVTFGGDPGTLYDVALRVRGVVEPKIYMGGMSDGTHFYTGGQAAADVYNVYSFDVSSPKEIYFFNFDEGKGEGHYVFAIDHMKTIRIEGGASIEMIAYDANCSAIRNCQDGTIGPNCVPIVIPDVPPDTGYNGQFVQIDVVSVTVVP
jgi:hypothetical protein